ncbi:BglII/BstYI family type II restriction endonuclease [Arthrobacter sp. zg-Y877]|uniref:BglII/BstYI family type II restriction endonuclease n=1 Tax=Arthrobacter sp. zg-Y877 TaxID=3049074 RepID=UPI0025A3B0D9|nr:BglII/BstYI family type II restriction endonuclease [Arthrobacter sp. zg-Y877]MDM7990709.1 BglII/BstYI family type II restriction endonuclease [Arthrobacter sp. zg-Y877]
MELTESWRNVFPDEVTSRYEIAETRNAAAVMKATTPDAFADMIRVLSDFRLTLDKLTTPGGSKTVIAKELDDSFRLSGWREARYDQELTTTLTVFRWSDGDTSEETQKIVSQNSYGGHKVDNVLGRAALDVEWNPKDGNLDRDLSNYVSLHEGGVIDVGVIVTRVGAGLREHVKSLIAETRAVAVPGENAPWAKRMKKLSDDPLGTSTTANFDKLKPRLERGDGRGCPILAIAITDRLYVPPADSIQEEVLRIAAKVQAGILPTEA